MGETWRQVSKIVKVTLLPFKDGLCVEEISNFPLVTSRKSCLSHTDYTDKSNTYSSLKVVFRSVGVQTNYRCPCATDYRGESCDTGLNLCYSNPCGNNGKCVSVEEGYSCICNPGRAGVNCEIDMSKSGLRLDRSMVRSLQVRSLQVRSLHTEVRSLHSKVSSLHHISYFAPYISYFAP